MSSISASATSDTTSSWRTPAIGGSTSCPGSRPVFERFVGVAAAQLPGREERGEQPRDERDAGGEGEHAAVDGDFLRARQGRPEIRTSASTP